MADTVLINSVLLTPNSLNAGASYTIQVSALFFMPLSGFFFDRSPFDRGVWITEPEPEPGR